MERPAERRLITAMFVDVVGSTELQMRMGPERMKRAIDAAFAQLHDVIVAQGGTVEKFIGDAVFAIFGAPTAHEDDALRALRAAEGCVRWAEATSSGGAPFAVRIGVETGEALVDIRGVGSEHQQMAVGTCVNTAARLQQLADPMKVVVGPLCREATLGAADLADVGERDLKGIGRVHVYELSRVVPGEAQRTRLPFVGREGELEMLDLALRRTRSGRSVLALVAGPPGQGKSRLVEEFLARADGSLTVLAARCRPAGENGARNVLRQLLAADSGADDVVRIHDRIASLIADRDAAARVTTWVTHSAGLSAEAVDTIGVEERQDEIADAWRRYLAALAVERPVVVWIEDVHWSEPELVRLVDRLTNGARIPLLVIATARPEFAEQAGLRPSGDRVFIGVDALDRKDALELARLAGAEDAASAERGQGNPLFIIELARVRDTAGSLPLTLQGAIGARLDDLMPADRELLSRCAVVGETFTARDAALITQRDRAEVERELDLLSDRQYVEQIGRDYRFQHALVRDVAYQRLPIAERMRLHARFGREGAADDIETRAYHLWEAIRPPDGEWVWEDAGERDALRATAFATLIEAGTRYAQRFAHASALSAYERALTLAAAPLERARAERALGDAYRMKVASEEAWTHYLRARDAYREAGAVPAAVYADLLRLVVRWPGGFRKLPADEEVLALVEEGEAVARESADVVSLASIVLDRAGLALRQDPEHVEMATMDEGLTLLRDAGFPEGSADLLLSVVDMQLSMRDPRAAAQTMQQVNALIAGGARVSDEDSYLRGASSIAADLGRLDEARVAADAHFAAMTRRGPHLLSHAIASRSYLAWCSGEDDVLLALAVRAANLLEENPSTRFCVGGVGGTLREAAMYLVLGGRMDEARDYVRKAGSTALERFRDTVLVVPNAMLGELASVDRGMDTARTNLPFSAAVVLCMLERWDELPPLLERFERWGAKGAVPLDAVASAIREEMAAAKGGPAPRHEALHALGFHGWSRLVSFRPAAAARAADTLHAI